ncbi:MAG: hypothetical protein P8015_17125, partial [Acidihalobacter sp.]
AFLSYLSLGVQRKVLGRVTQVGSILETLIRARKAPQTQSNASASRIVPHLKSRTKSAARVSKHVAFTDHKR